MMKSGARQGLVLLLALVSLGSGLTATTVESGSEPASLLITGRISFATTAAPARAELYPLFRDYTEAEKLLPGAPPPQPLATANVNADGTFELAAPETGAYRIVLRADGFLTVEHSILPLVESTALPGVELARAEPLILRLRDEEGGPLQGVEVRATCSEQRTSSKAGWKRTDRAGGTAAKGEAILQRGPAEACDLYLLHPEYLGLAAQGVASSSVLELRLKRRRLERFLAGHSISGLGAGAIVSFGSWPAAKVGVSGFWLAAAPERGQTWPLALQGPGGEAGMTTVSWGRTRQSLSFLQPAVVKGRVVDAAGSPVAKALVWSESPFHSPVHTAADGRFTLVTAPLLSLDLGFAAAGYQTLHLTVNSESGSPAPLQVRLEARPANSP
jgi:hypothetical protein